MSDLPNQSPAQPIGLAMIHTRTIVGIDAVPVVVEVHLANGLPAFSTVGLPETAVRESKDRVRSAILNSGFEFPAKRITVNLSPADLPKSGGRFDLPIAIGILIASAQLKGVDVEQVELMGELALDGQLRPTNGVLPSAAACASANRNLIIPEANAGEAGLAKQTESFAAPHLLDVCYHLVGRTLLPACVQPPYSDQVVSYPDLIDVKGQPHAKRALEVAASGNHSLLFIGPPGVGKSMLASRLPGILPDLDQSEMLQVAAIQSIALGVLDIESCRTRPFRSPHHSASSTALVGGGSYPRPGEITLAHRGALFLDELTEFSRSALEQLREPLETGRINIARAKQSVEYPACFQLLAACNPCKCGYLGDGTDRCQCSATSIEKYRSKLSGPLLDRIDMHVHLQRVDMKTLQGTDVNSEASGIVKQRVINIRETQTKRQGTLNGQLESKELDKVCALDQTLLRFIETVCEKLNMSARAYHRILKLSRTIADMADEERISKAHIAEALGYRSLDRR